MVGFKCAVIALNGGDVTREEIYGALARQLPVIVVEGSGREADAFVKAFRDGDWSLTAKEMRANLVKKNKPEAPADAVVAACQGGRWRAVDREPGQHRAPVGREGHARGPRRPRLHGLSFSLESET